MKSIFSILAVLAFAHIARPEAVDAVAQSVVLAPAESSTCSGNGQTLHLGEWECADKTTWRMCDHGGKWFEGKCEEGECMLLPNDPKKVQCFKFVHVPYPTGPNGEVHQPELKPATGGAHLRHRRNDDPHAEHAKPQSTDVKAEEGVQAAPPPTQTTCSGNGKTLQLGDWECADKTTWRMCDHGGKWFEGKCDEGECMVLPTDPKKIQCFKFIHYPYPTGPNGEMHEPNLKPKTGSALLRRRRSDDPHAEHAKPQATDVKPDEGVQAAQAPPPSATCTGNGQTLQLGDWECADKTTWRLCDHGGKWFEGKCEEGECMVLPNDPKKIQCFKFTHYPYPTGPNGEMHEPNLKPKTGGRLLRFRRSAN